MADTADARHRFGANRYIDTRGATADPVSFTHAVVEGLAEGGGLYVPQHIPTMGLDAIAELAHMPYAQRAASVFKAFDIDIPDEEIDDITTRSYGGNFDCEAICPVVSLDESTYILELWHGPTGAFKDMALQCLPHFVSASARALREHGELCDDLCILVATSGDTGKAALEGFKNVAGTSIGVLFPDGGVSDIQRKQMVTTTGDNVGVWAVAGNFDDCQTGVKRVFSDEAFSERLHEDVGMSLSSANSINWGRLLPQVVYYISSYAELVAGGSIALGSPIDVCVPTGNFGNILAAWYAKQIGTPIDALICASNENHVLSDFISSGVYDIRDRPFTLTPSPSMDILVSSNLERQLFELSGRNAALIDEWMRDLRDERRFVVDDGTLAAMQQDFRAGWTSSENCLHTIKNVLDEHDYLLDPHTAVAYAVAGKMRRENPVLIAGTAHWAKFGDNVLRAISGIPVGGELPAEARDLTGCEINELIAERTGHHDIPEKLACLDDLPVRFTDVIAGDVENIESAVAKFLGSMAAN